MTKKKLYKSPESIAEKQVFLIFSKWLHKDLTAVFRSSQITNVSLRYYVDMLYKIQDLRISIYNQELAALKNNEPASFVHALAKTLFILENALKQGLGQYLAQFRIAQWIAAHYGIGFIIAAGLLSRLDIRKVKTVSSFWRFAGLDPTSGIERKKGHKLPYNVWLKSFIIGRLGECFVKTSTKEQSFYGNWYLTWKQEILERNERGEFEKAAKQLLEQYSGKFKDREETWKQGRLTEAHCKRRARRLTIKLFLSHLFDQMYLDYYAQNPPKPYIFWKDPNHTHKIDPPFSILDFQGKTLREFYKPDNSLLDGSVTAVRSVLDKSH